MSKRAILLSPKRTTLRSVLGDTLSRFNMVLNGGKRFNTTETDSGGVQHIWVANAASFIDTASKAPDGTTVTRFREDSSFNSHSINCQGGGGGSFSLQVLPAQDMRYQLTIIAKADGRNRIVGKIQGGGSECTVGFNLATGQTNYSNATTGGASGWAAPTSSIVPLEDSCGGR